MATSTTTIRMTAVAAIAALCLSGGSFDSEAIETTVAALPAARAVSDPTPNVSQTTVPAPEPVVVVSLSVDEQVMVDWAFGLFTDAGLDLPEVAVSFHSDVEACHGTDGRWEHDEGTPDRVMICVTHNKPLVQAEWQRRTLVHELAHAWAQANLNDIDRAEFLALRDLDSWNNAADEWGRRGIEHAAEIVSWGVIDQKIHLWKLPNASCPAMTAAYRLLTGIVPVIGLVESCR